MTRERLNELISECETDLELAIAQGMKEWARTQRDRRQSLLALLRSRPDEPITVEKESA